MVRLKLAYWEFDFEAVCPTLDHDLLSQAHMPVWASHFTVISFLQRAYSVREDDGIRGLTHTVSS